MFKVKSSKELIIILFVVITTFISRIVRLSELFHFTYDESIIAFVGKRMFINGHIPLIGGVTPFHVHVSPYFYWLSGVLLFLSKLDPRGWGIFAGLLAGLTALLLYFIVSESFSKNIATISSILYVFSTYINVYDRHYWGLVFNHISSLLVFFSLYKIIHRKYKYYLLLSLVVAFSFHADGSTWIYIPLFLLTFLKFRPSLNNVKAKLAILIFILSFLPLLIFDLRKNFVNIGGLSTYFTEAKQSSNFSLNRLFFSLTFVPKTLSKILFNPNIDLAKEYSYCTSDVQSKLSIVNPLLVILVLLIVIGSFFKKDNSQNHSFWVIKCFLLILSLGVVSYAGIMGRPIFEHYLSTIFVPFIIMTALLIGQVYSKHKKIVIFFLLLFIIINTQYLSKLYHPYGFDTKYKAVIWAIDNINSDFALDSLSNCYKYNGYRYLFYLAGKEPTKSFVDQNFFWLYDKLPSEIHPKTLVVMVASDYKKDLILKHKYSQYKDRLINSKIFGELEVLIIDNTKGILYDF